MKIRLDSATGYFLVPQFYYRVNIRTRALGMALNVKEGNTNATGLAHKLRYNLHFLAKGIETPTPHPRVIDFLEKLK